MKTTSDTRYWHEIDSPIGRLLLAGDGESLIHVCFQSGPRPLSPAPGWVVDPSPFRTAVAQLEEYFAGQRRTFDLQLAPRGTEFQQRVWRALREIPYGNTVSYGELARGIGKPSASRAVGLANGANPLPIIVPCHRVIGTDGSLTGFGGGLPIKRRLLALEGATAGEAGPQCSFKWDARQQPAVAR
jgi:methylated-DNA-[protein]-cysteine S-methyltransferase